MDFITTQTSFPANPTVRITHPYGPDGRLRQPTGVSVRNTGKGVLYLGFGPTSDGEAIPAGETRTFDGQSTMLWIRSGDGQEVSGNAEWQYAPVPGYGWTNPTGDAVEATHAAKREPRVGAQGDAAIVTPIDVQAAGAKATKRAARKAAAKKPAAKKKSVAKTAKPVAKKAARKSAAKKAPAQNTVNTKAAGATAKKSARKAAKPARKSAK